MPWPRTPPRRLAARVCAAVTTCLLRGAPAAALLCTSLDYYGCDIYGNCPQCEPCEKHADCNSVCTSQGCFCHEEGFCLDCVQMKLDVIDLVQGVEINENQTGNTRTIYFKTCDDFDASIDGSCNVCTCRESEDCATDDDIGTNMSSYCSQLPVNSESRAAGKKYCYPCNDLLGVHCSTYNDAVDDCDATCDNGAAGLASGVPACVWIPLGAAWVAWTAQSQV